MEAVKKIELFETKKEEFKKYIKNHKIPTKNNDGYFENGNSMCSFFYKYKNELLKDPEIQEIIKSKIKEEKEKFTLEEEKLKKQEQNFLKELKELPTNFDKLSEIDRLIFYRECFLTPEKETNSYVIENIVVNKKQLTAFKELYYNYYATYLEKEKAKGNDPLTEKINQQELEKLEYLNTICNQTNWNESKLEELAKIYNCTKEDIKNSVIKYNYLSFYPETTGIKTARRKPTIFQTHQLKSTTIEEIEAVKAPVQLNEYLEYKNNNESNWKYLKKINMPTDETIKMIYNIQTKANLFCRNIENKKIKEIAQKENNLKEKIELTEKEINSVLENIENQTFATMTDFYKINNLDPKEFRKSMNFLKENNNKLYQKFKTTIEAKKEEKIDPNEEIYNLVNLLKKYKEEGKEFTIIDYQKTTSIPIQEMKKCLNKFDITNEDKKIIQTFVSITLSSRPLKIKQILSIKTTLQDKNNNPVTPNSNEIKEIINFMEENNIPLLNKTYNTILKLYINDELKINQEKNRKL
ncbi:MAG: hypothetical protein ACI31R_03160 [Bacilli bacterium]